MRQIKASEIKPGMNIQFDLGGWDVKGAVAHTILRDQVGIWVYTDQECEMSLGFADPVTVLSEPQPEEPTEFGAKARVRDRYFLRMGEVGVGRYIWVEKGSGSRWAWDDLCAMGPVQVVPDQGWTVPAETPEAPEWIEQWDTWEDVPEGVAVTAPILVCHYRKNQGVPEFRDPKGNPDWAKTGNYGLSYTLGPWTRVTDA